MIMDSTLFQNMTMGLIYAFCGICVSIFAIIVFFGIFFVLNAIAAMFNFPVVVFYAILGISVLIAFIIGYNRQIG